MVGRVLVLVAFLTTTPLSNAQDITQVCRDDGMKYCRAILVASPPTREQLIACGKKLLTIVHFIKPACANMLQEYKKNM